MNRVLINVFNFSCFLFLSLNSFTQVKKIDSLQHQLSNPSISVESKFDINLKLSSLLTQSETQRAMPYIEESFHLAEQLGDKVKLGSVYQQRGVYYEKIGEFDSAMLDLDKSLSFVNNTNEGQKLLVYINTAKGSVLRRQSKYEEAMKALLNANATAERMQDDTLLYSTYTQLGILSVTMKNLERAIEYHKKALDIALHMNSDKRVAKTYGNIGIIYREQKNHKEGIVYNEKALTYAYKSGDSSAISNALSELGTMYKRDKQCEKALPYLYDAIAIRERTNEQSELAYSYFYLGSALSCVGRVNESEVWIRKSLIQAQKINNMKQIIDAYHMMYLNFDENGKSDSALVYLKVYTNMRDSVSGIEVKEKIEELNIKYDSQAKDIKIKDEKLKNTYLWGGIGLLVMSLALLFSAFLRRKLVFKNELQKSLMLEQDKSTKEIIDAEENERQRIASDLHDGVGQYMTAAKMNLEALGENLHFNSEKESQMYRNAISLVNDSVNEVRTISHNMMPNALIKNGLGNAVRGFLDNLNQQKTKVQLFTDGLNIPIESNIEIFLYRIIQECVNNVLKHANASELNISILINQREIDITIEDNGIGFDIEKIKSNAGIGVSNIQKRVQFIKGTIEWDSTEGKGTTVMIHVPLKNGIA